MLDDDDDDGGGDGDDWRRLIHIPSIEMLQQVYEFFYWILLKVSQSHTQTHTNRRMQTHPHA
jgi:hypothetical protein